MWSRVAGTGRRREDGAAAVEFAIVAPLLFMMVFGIIQFGIFFAQDLALSNGARQAARAAAVPATGDCDSIEAEARQGAVTVALNPDSPAFDITVYVPQEPGVDQCDGVRRGTPPCVGAPSGTEVRVEIEYDEAQLALPLVGDFSNITLIREGSFRCEFA